MKTPLLEAVDGYLSRGRSPLHMPGHKGRPIPPVGEAARFDITEVEGADSLFEASGPIAELEAAYARLYGAKGSFLSAGGSTLCIQAMLALAAKPGQTVIAGRQIHTAAVNAMALLDLQPVWAYPRISPELRCAAPVTSQDIEPLLRGHPDAAAVYITSPDYFGCMADVSSIAALCKETGVPLLVDNAHGAHLIKAPGAPHPICQGASLCCDSLHKSLPVLTGGALLHVGDSCFLAEAKKRMALFGSTSPSYIIMLSADQALPYVEDKLEGDIVRVSQRVDALRGQAKEAGFGVPEEPLDPFKLTLGFWSLGYTAEDFGRLLREGGVEPELVDGTAAVLMFSGFSAEEDFQRVSACVSAAERRGALAVPLVRMPIPETALTLREAVFANAEEIPLPEAEGRIAGSMVSPCPPGIPLVIPGERIRRETAELLSGYGISRINVVK